MANGKSTGSKKAKDQEWKFRGFHNITLSEEERSEYLQSGADRESQLLNSYVLLAERGWKCSFSFDGWRDAFCFSVTAKKTQTSFDGYCFTFYHRDPERAVGIGSWYIERVTNDEAIFVPADKKDLDW